MSDGEAVCQGAVHVCMDLETQAAYKAGVRRRIGRGEEMNRRVFLIALPALGLSSVGVPVVAATLAERLVMVLPSRADAARIGRVFLATYPGEGPVEELVARVYGPLAAAGFAPDRMRPSELRGALAHQIRRDFAVASTIPVDGWILSATEARLCGLAALVEVDPMARTTRKLG